MFPRWLSWLVLALFAYLIVQGNRHSAPVLPTATPAAPAVDEVKKEAAPAAEVKLPTPALDQATDLEHWKRSINPDYAARIQCTLVAKPGDKPKLLWKVTEEVTGSGPAAKCTDAIPVKLTIWSPRGEVAYQGDATVTLGAREIAAGLDAALIGLREGGSRTVILANEALERDKKAPAAKPLLAAIGTNRVAIVTVERIATSQ